MSVRDSVPAYMLDDFDVTVSRLEGCGHGGEGLSLMVLVALMAKETSMAKETFAPFEDAVSVVRHPCEDYDLVGAM